MNTFHSFTKRISENILLPLFGRRQHQTACQLGEKWTTETDWMQELSVDVQHTGEEHPIQATVQKGQLRSPGRLKNGSPLHLIPGLCVDRWPGNANTTHSKCGHMTALLSDWPEHMIWCLHCFYAFTCARSERRDDIRWGTRAMQSKSTYSSIKSSGTKII